MKKLIALVASLSLMLGLTPFAYGQGVATLNVSMYMGGEKSVTAWVDDTNITSRQIHVLRCSPQNSWEDSTHIAESQSTMITLTNLKADTWYNCDVYIVPITRRGDSYGYSPVFAVKTEKSETVQIDDYSSDSNSIRFWLRERNLSPGDQYYIECRPEGRNGSNAWALGTSTDLTLVDLLPNQLYNCFAALKKPNNSYSKHSNTISIRTTSPTPPQRVVISSIDTADTQVTFELEPMDIYTGEKYFIECEEARSPYGKFAVSGTNNSLTLKGLTPDTTYYCFGAIVFRGAINKQSRQSTVVTAEPSFSPVVIANHNVFENQATIWLGSERKPGYDQVYRGTCHDRNRRGVSYTVDSSISEVHFEDLGWDADYECYVGIYDYNSRELMYVSDLVFFRVGNNPKGPGAVYFEDPVIEDWSGYKRFFPDTDTRTVAGQAAEELNRRGVIGGYGDGEFKGYRNVNRAEAAKFLLETRYFAVPTTPYDGSFPDVGRDAWFTTYVTRAAQEGIISGYPDRMFRPGNEINTAEFMKMFVKNFNLRENLSHRLVDVDSRAWYARYAGAAEFYNLFPSRGNRLEPTRMMTREDVAVAIYQYLRNR